MINLKGNLTVKERMFTTGSKYCSPCINKWSLPFNNEDMANQITVAFFPIFNGYKTELNTQWILQMWQTDTDL